MKNLSPKSKVVALLAISAAAAFVLQTFGQSTKSHRWPPKVGNCKEPSNLPQANAPFVKKIAPRRHLKKMTDAGEAEFAALLCNGHYDAAKGNLIHFKHGNANLGEHCLPLDCSDFAQLSIKTDKVIVSEAAKNA